MSENFDGDIYEKIEYMPITFFANTLRVGIIGGGRGSYIKARTLSNSGVEVEVLSREFIEDFHSIPVTLIKKEYDKLEYALHEVREKGYGIVNPTVDDLILEEPEIIRQGSKFGVKLKAKAPSLHMIRINTETEISPIVGSEKQSEELVNYLLSEFEEDKKKIWDSNIFGKSVHDLVNEGLQNKLARMPEEAQMKIQETLQRIVNEGSGGLICIIL